MPSNLPRNTEEKRLNEGLSCFFLTFAAYSLCTIFSCSKFGHASAISASLEASRIVVLLNFGKGRPGTLKRNPNEVTLLHISHSMEAISASQLPFPASNTSS